MHQPVRRRCASLSFLFVAAAAVVLAGSAQGDTSSVAVEELTFAEFEDQARTGRWLVEFYAPWCGICRNFEPKYLAVARRVEAHGVRAVKVDADRFGIFLYRFNVDHFPDFVLIEDGRAWTFEGERTVDNLVDFASNKSGARELSGRLLGPMSPLWRFIGRAFSTVTGLVYELREWSIPKILGVLLLLFTSILLFLVLLLYWFAKPKAD